jgi:hypothetical protein
VYYLYVTCTYFFKRMALSFCHFVSLVFCHTKTTTLTVTGQRFSAPTPGYGDRVFYETLLRQRPESAMAQEWYVPCTFFKFCKRQCTRYQLVCIDSLYIVTYVYCTHSRDVEVPFQKMVSHTIPIRYQSYYPLSRLHALYVHTSQVRFVRSAAVRRSGKAQQACHGSQT